MAAALLAGLIAAGCTPEARDDVSQAGSNLNDAAKKSAEGTAVAVDKAGADAKAGADKMAANAKAGADKMATNAKEGARMAGEAVGGAGDTLTLTPKVKGALVQSKDIDASTLNVDTKADTKTIVIKGTQPTEAKKKMVTQIAEKALKDANAPYKIENDVTIAPNKS